MCWKRQGTARMDRRVKHAHPGDGSVAAGCQKHVFSPGLRLQAAALAMGYESAQTLGGSDHLPCITLFHRVEFLVVSALAAVICLLENEKGKGGLFFPLLCLS